MLINMNKFFYLGVNEPQIYSNCLNLFNTALIVAFVIFFLRDKVYSNSYIFLKFVNQTKKLFN
jgi:hypothetical protein